MQPPPPSNGGFGGPFGPGQGPPQPGPSQPGYSHPGQPHPGQSHPGYSNPGYSQSGRPHIAGPASGPAPSSGGWAVHSSTSSPNVLAAGAFQGAHVGRYELLLELASGGMGSVYVGRQRGAAGFERLVAIKRMHPHLAQDPELTLAFHEEARIASLIRHPNAVQVVDVYEERGEHLLVMEYIEGGAVSTLVSAARRRSLKIARPVALRIAIDALRGLHAAHELVGLDGNPLQVVHRDVSPQNILVASDGTVRLTDFGIARALQRLVHTATGSLKGKLRYMSPEQAMNRPVDRRADVFALGIVLYEMLSGDKLYAGDTDLEVLQAAANGQIAPLSSKSPDVPRDLEAIVMTALAFEPDARYPTALSFAEALERWAVQSREAATQSDVAAHVRTLLGESIEGRRRQIQDLVTGRAPISLRSGVNPIVHPGTPTASPSILGARSSGAHPPAGGRWALFALLGVGALGIGIGVGTLLYARMLAKPKVATERAEATAAPAADRVVVKVFAEGVSGVVGPDVSNVQFTSDGASFELPRGGDPVDVEIRFADGSVRKERVDPNANAALRLEPAVTPSATAAAGASSAPAPDASDAPSAAPVASASAKPKSSPNAGGPRTPPPPGGGLRKSPY